MNRTLVAMILLCASTGCLGAEDFDVLKSALMAPCTVHVRKEVPESASLASQLQWDFGDPTGQHNRLEGFNAAHFYAKPGEYSITLTQSAGGKTETFTKKILVVQDRRSTVYVSNSGSDATPGMTPARPIRSVGRAFGAIGNNATILLHRGESFALPDTITIDKRNIVVGAYGDGAAPLLRGSRASVRDIFAVAGSAADVTFRDIAFDSPTPQNLNKDGAPRAIEAAGTNITLENLTFINVCDCVNAERGPRGLLMEGCVAPNDTSIRGYFLWGNGSDLVVLGCSAKNSTREHIIRLGGADHLLIAGNDFANIDRRSAGDAQDIAKGTLVLQKCSWAYAAANVIHGGNLGAGPLNGADGVHDPDAETHCIVVERNRIDDANFLVVPGTHYVCVRNNIFHSSGGPVVMVMPTDATKLPDGRPAYANRTVSNIFILHNTASTPSTDGRFLTVLSPAPDGAITLRANVYVAPNFETGGQQNAAVYVTAKDLSGFANIADNVWPIPKKSSPPGVLNYVWPSWYDPAGYKTLEQWSQLPQVHHDTAMNVELDAHDSPNQRWPAEAVPEVFDDFNKNPRRAGDRTAGAVELP